MSYINRAGVSENPTQDQTPSSEIDLKDSIGLWKWGGDFHRYIYGDALEKPSERAIMQLNEIMQLIDEHTAKAIIAARIDEVQLFENHGKTVGAPLTGYRYYLIERLEKLKSQGDK